VALLPVILLFGSIGYWFEFKSTKSGLKNHLSDYWLNEEEKNEFKTLFVRRKEYAEIIAVKERKAQEIGIHRNKDGQYSTRSNLGKEIRETYGSYKPLIEEIDERLNELREQPLEKWQEFNSAASNSKAFPIALSIWLGIVLYYMTSAYELGAFELQPKAVFMYFGKAFISVFLKVITMGSGDIVCPIGSFQVIGYSFGGAIIGLIVCKIILSNYGAKFSPKPPKVAMENIDLQNMSDGIS